MLKNEKITIVYEGKHIRIGIGKENNYVYFQPNHLDTIWFRFDPDYYTDYSEFLEDYKNSKVVE